MGLPFAELGAVIILAAGLIAIAERDAPLVPINDAESREGQRVTMSGWVDDLRGGDDWTRFVLVEDGNGVTVAWDEKPQFADEDFVVVTGYLVRFDGRLTLAADNISWNL